MANDGDTTPAFADALRAAIRASGLSLEGVSRRLATRGCPVSIGTLSYWQTGRREPARQDSLRAVTLLEALLGLPQHELSSLLRPPPMRGRAPREAGMLPIASPFDFGDEIRALLSEVDMSSDGKLMRISQHDRLVIGPRRTRESLVVRQILRAMEDGPDRFVIAFFHDEPHPLPELRALRGCQVGKHIVDPSVPALVAELVFDHPLATGETVVTEHECIGGGVPPMVSHDSYGRSLRHPIRECLIEVDFHPVAVPDRCARVLRPEGRPDQVTTRRLVPGNDGRVSAVESGFGPGVFEIQWEWNQ